MRKLILLLALLCALPAWPRTAGSHHSSRSSGGTKTVHVRSYNTKRGRHVNAYRRRPPR